MSGIDRLKVIYNLDKIVARNSVFENEKKYGLWCSSYANGEVIGLRNGCGNGNPDIGSFANVKKNYRWSGKSRRIVRSACCAVYYDWVDNGSVGNVFFITLTEKVNIENNLPITNFINNMRKRGYIDKFVWVRERQIKRGIVNGVYVNHYHLVFSSLHVLIDIPVFLGAWNSAMVSCGGVGSKNSVRLGKRPVIENIGCVSNYISKYMSKGVMDEDFRLYGYSRGLCIKLLGSLSSNFVKYKSPVVSAASPYVYLAKFPTNIEWWNYQKYINNKYSV